MSTSPALDGWNQLGKREALGPVIGPVALLHLAEGLALDVLLSVDGPE